MPPLPLLPNQPTGSPDWFTPTGVTPSSPSTTGTRPGMTWYPSQAFGEVPSGAFPSGWTADDIQRTIAGYDRYIATQTEQWQQTSGLERKQIEAQIEDAKKGRENAMEIARLQSETSRYGIDQGRQTQIEQLKENQRQFNARHDLDLQQFGLSQDKFGLDIANAYTKYASTPDMRWSANDFDEAVQRVGLGQQPRPITQQAAPTPKTYEQFNVLRQYSPSGGGAGAPVPTAVTDQQSGGGSVQGGGMEQRPDGSWQQKAAPDARLKAIRAVADAIPPSDTTGADGQDWAALQAMKSIYFSNRPGAVERLGAARRKIADAGLARLGYDPELVNSDYINRTRMNQGRVTSA